MSELTSREALKLICKHKPKWLETFNENELMEYIFIAEIGREIIDNIAQRKDQNLIKEVFKTIESILSDCTIDASTLIGAGLFEAMQSAACDILDQPDTKDYIFEKSQKLWHDIMGGWRDEGVITIDDIQEKLRINAYQVDSVDEIYEDSHFGIDVVKFSNCSIKYISYWVDIYDDHLQFYTQVEENELNKLLSLIKSATNNVKIQSIICNYMEGQKRVIKYSSYAGFEIGEGSEYTLSGPPW